MQLGRIAYQGRELVAWRVESERQNRAQRAYLSKFFLVRGCRRSTRSVRAASQPSCKK